MNVCVNMCLMRRNPSVTCERVLIRVPNWLGDAVMAIPALHALRAAFPKAHVAVDARPGIAPLFDSVSVVDEVHVCSASGGFRNLREKCAHAGVLRREKFDTGILLTNSFSTACFMRLAGVRRRIGLSTSGRKLFLTDAVPLTRDLMEAHQTEWYGALVRTLGTDASERALLDAPLGLPLVEPSPAACDEAAAALEGVGLGNTPFAVLAPGSAYGPAKDWLPDRFAELAQCFLLAGMQVVITGSPKDAAHAEAIARDAGVGTVSMAGKTRLPGFLGILSRAACFVGNDSGAAHCAAAIGIPTVAIFGSTRPGRTRPFGKQVTCVVGEASCAPCMRRVCPQESAMECMRSVTVPMVWEALAPFGIFEESDALTAEGSNADCACLDR